MTVRMVCILMALFLALLPIGGHVFAQDQPPSADDIVAKMQSKLNLTQDQVTAVTPIIEKYSSKREELRQSMEDGSVDKASMYSQMKQLKEDETQELAQFLSEDQINRWKRMQGKLHQEWQKQNTEGESSGTSA